MLCSDNEVHKDLRGIGGVGNHVYELSRALAKLGNEITIVAQSDSSWTKDIEPGLSIVGIPSSNYGRLKLVNYSRAVYSIVRHMVDHELVDCIQFHNLTGLAFYLRGKNLHTPSWTKCHGVNDPYTANLNVATRLRIAPFIKDATISAAYSRICYRLSPHIIANSRSTSERLVQYYHVDPARISVVHNGVNHDIFNTRANPYALRARLGMENSIVLLYVGDFSFLKGIVHLIYSVRRVLREIPGVSLIMVGGYTHTSWREIRRLVRKLGLAERITIENYVPHNELPKYYAASDICVIPSLCEPFGNVALEAMACGRPVIAFKTGGLAEIVRHDVGITVEPGSIESFSNAIMRLAKDEDLRTEMGRNGTKYSRKFTWEQTAQETIKVMKAFRKHEFYRSAFARFVGE